MLILHYYYYEYVVQANKNIIFYSSSPSSLRSGIHGMYSYGNRNLLLPREWQRQQQRRLSRSTWTASKIRHFLKKMNYSKRNIDPALKRHYSEVAIRICNDLGRTICAKKYNRHEEHLFVYQICHDDVMMQCLKNKTYLQKL